MPANSPEDICRLFQQAMAEGDLESVMSAYDPQAVFVNPAGEIKKGKDACMPCRFGASGTRAGPATSVQAQQQERMEQARRRNLQQHSKKAEESRPAGG